MKLVMTLLVRDEADILDETIRFHLARGVDFIIAMDNLSVDRTPAILRGYAQRGALCHLVQPDDDFAQHRWVTDMARMAAREFGADWVINGDADEFWWPETGDLKDVLAAVPVSYSAVAVRRVNFLPRPMAPGTLFADAMAVRERASRNAFGQPLPDKVCHRGYPDVVLSQGSHRALRGTQELVTTRAAVTILHFPARSFRQFAGRIAQHGRAYSRNKELPPATGAVKRHLYDLWSRGELGAHYRSLVLDEDEIERGLRDGRLVADDRLKTALAQLHEQRGDGP